MWFVAGGLQGTDLAFLLDPLGWLRSLDNAIAIETLGNAAEVVAAVLAIEEPERSDKQREQLAAHYRSIAPELAPQRAALAKLEFSRDRLTPEGYLLPADVEQLVQWLPALAASNERHRLYPRRRSAFITVESLVILVERRRAAVRAK